MGLVSELHQKHLLALNVRNTEEAWSLAPRAYLLSVATARAFGGAAVSAAALAMNEDYPTEPLSLDKLTDNEQAFTLDFLMSQAAVILQFANCDRQQHLAACCTAQPGASNAQHSSALHPALLDTQLLKLACAVCRAYFATDNMSLQEEHSKGREEDCVEQARLCAAAAACCSRSVCSALTPQMVEAQEGSREETSEEGAGVHTQRSQYQDARGEVARVLQALRVKAPKLQLNLL